jgi:hypothetical protein
VRAKLELRAAHADAKILGARHERGLVQNAIDVAVRAKGLLGEVSFPAHGQAQLQYVLSVLAPHAPGTLPTRVEIDLVDGLGKPPNGLPCFTRKRLVHGKMNDVRRKKPPHHVGRGADVRDAFAISTLADEERDRHFVVVPEVVVSVVDARDAEQPATRKDLGDLELSTGQQGLSGSRAHQPGGRSGTRVPDDAGHGDGAPLNEIVARAGLAQLGFHCGGVYGRLSPLATESPAR